MYYKYVALILLYKVQLKIKWNSFSTSTLSQTLHILSSTGLFCHLPVSISNDKIPHRYCAKQDLWFLFMNDKA